jgi:tetratricopeptide (TPR) repeat protein
VGKLLAANVADRYPNAGAIREDLQRFAAGEPVLALHDGWPTPADEAVTRRTIRLSDEEATRRTVREPRDASVTAAAGSAEASGPTAVGKPAASPAKPRGRLRRFVRRALIVIAIFVVLKEIRIHIAAEALAGNVPEELGGVVQMWNTYGALNDGSLGLGVRPLERALKRQSMLLADRTFTRYRTAGATVYEREWQLSRDALAFARRADPSDSQLDAAWRYCEGHLHRIQGEAHVRGKQAQAGREELTASVTAFREAAERRPGWPDPFLGLMRTFLAMDDIERSADALAQAQQHGYTAGNREWALLGDAYLTRAAKLAESDELEPLTRAADAYTQAIDLFSKAVGFGNAARRLREAERRLRDVQERIGQLMFVASIDRETTA